MIRKLTGYLMILTAIFNVYVFIYTIYMWTDGFKQWFLNIILFDIIWGPIGPLVASIVSIVLLTLGCVNAFKRKRWWPILLGSIISLFMPIYWIQITYGEQGIVSRLVFLVGIILIFLAIVSRRDFISTTINNINT
jgi:hypothetical protein